MNTLILPKVQEVAVTQMTLRGRNTETPKFILQVQKGRLGEWEGKEMTIKNR